MSAHTLPVAIDSVASLFAYMGVTAVLMAVVPLMPARRGRHWTAPADER
jgi:hypothetical protein